MSARSHSPCLRAVALAATAGALLLWGVLANAHPTTLVANIHPPSSAREAAHLLHTGSFIPVRDANNLCGQFTAPEPVSTREPMDFGGDARARLNFVVNSTGQVNGVVILNVSGQLDQQALVEAVIGWRFHPALCDGAPIDSEATLDLESRR